MRLLPSAATGACDAVAGGVAVVVDDGDFPAGVGGAGGRCCEVACEGGVERSEEAVVPGAFRCKGPRLIALLLFISAGSINPQLLSLERL